MAIDPQALGAFLFGLIQLALAAILFSLGMSNRANRTYALFSCLVGFHMTMQGIPALVSDPGVQDFFLRVGGYFRMASPLALLYFVLTYPRPRFRWLEGARGPLLLVAAMAVPVGLYAFNHDWLLEGGNAPLYPEGGRGPLTLYNAYGLNAIIGIAAVLFLKDAAKATVPVARKTVLLMGSQILGYGAFYAMSNPFGAFATGHALDYGIRGWFDDLVLLVLVVWATRILVGMLRSSDVLGQRRLVRRCVGLVVMGYATGVAGGWAFVATGSPVVYGLLQTVWLLLHPVVVTYCILRHQMFDIDIRFKASIDRGSLGGIYFAVFLVVSRLAETFVQATFQGQHWLFGGLSAGVLLLALVPLQRLTHRLANRALPGVKPISSMSESERTEFYRAQLLLALSDGGISHDERRMLDFARKQLGVTLETARQLEGDARGTPIARGV